jgi:hypothetical protein
MENRQLVNLLTGSSIEASKTGALLDESNIATFTKSILGSARVASFGISQNNAELRLKADDLDHTEKILEEVNEANDK